MQHFVVTAWDYRDDDALARRMQHRDAHLASVDELIKAGHFLSGGAILDDAGAMIGSSLHMAFPDKASLIERLDQDPYMSGKVWERLEIFALRRVSVPA